MDTELRMLEDGPQMNIHPDGLKATLKKIANWKIPGQNGIHEFWFKKSPPNTTDLQLKWINAETEILEWMIKGKTTLIQKDPLKRTAPTNYRPITCLPMIWKLLTAQIRDKIYYSLINHGISPDEPKGCRKRTRDSEELLYRDQHILNESKTRRNNLAMAWSDEWKKKGLRYGPPKLDTTLSQNV